jgi:hypothetical protein
VRAGGWLMPDRTTIKLGKRWSLEDLAVFSMKYNQAYSFIYSISPSVIEQEDIVRLYQQYPWRGGYSAVNFYYQLYARTPKQDRPEVVQIQYASPGFILLMQVIAVAGTLGSLIVGAAKGAERISAAYTQIKRDMADRKLTRIDLRLADAKVSSEELKTLREQMEFVKDSTAWFSSELGISEEFIDVLNRRSNSETLSQLKMLLSLYRRIEPLAKLQNEGKLDVTPLIAEKKNDS